MVCHLYFVTVWGSTGSFHSNCPYWTIVLYYLAADGVGLTGSQVAIEVLLQIDAHLVGALHLEMVHGLTGVRVEETVVAAVIAVRLGCCYIGWNMRNYLYPKAS